MIFNCHVNISGTINFYFYMSISLYICFQDPQRWFASCESDSLIRCKELRSYLTLHAVDPSALHYDWIIQSFANVNNL